MTSYQRLMEEAKAEFERQVNDPKLRWSRETVETATELVEQWWDDLTDEEK